jgi:hypothetical protein
VLKELLLGQALIPVAHITYDSKVSKAVSKMDQFLVFVPIKHILLCLFAFNVVVALGRFDCVNIFKNISLHLTRLQTYISLVKILANITNLIEVLLKYSAKLSK